MLILRSQLVSVMWAARCHCHELVINWQCWSFCCCETTAAGDSCCARWNPFFHEHTRGDFIVVITWFVLEQFCRWLKDEWLRVECENSIRNFSWYIVKCYVASRMTGSDKNDKKSLKNILLEKYLFMRLPCDYKLLFHIKTMLGFGMHFHVVCSAIAFFTDGTLMVGTFDQDAFSFGHVLAFAFLYFVERFHFRSCWV